MQFEQESVLSSYRVDGRVAVVTGGSRGIGFGCAQALAEAGAEVVLVARGGAALDDAAASIPGATCLSCCVKDSTRLPQADGGTTRSHIRLK